MNSAIKLILKVKNMKQSELICDGISKQTVFKYINGERKINRKIASKWEKLLQVPEEYWLGNDGYCRNLTESEVVNLSKYIVYNKDMKNYHSKKKEYAIKYVKTYEETYIVKAENYDEATNIIDQSIRAGFINMPKKCISANFIDFTNRVKRKDKCTIITY